MKAAYLGSVASPIRCMEHARAIVRVLSASVVRSAMCLEKLSVSLHLFFDPCDPFFDDDYCVRPCFVYLGGVTSTKATRVWFSGGVLGLSFVEFCFEI